MPRYVVIINANPRKPSIIGMVIGASLFVVGAWLLYLDWKALLSFLKIFAGFFLVLLGLGTFLSALMQRGYA